MEQCGYPECGSTDTNFTCDKNNRVSAHCGLEVLWSGCGGQYCSKHTAAADGNGFIRCMEPSCDSKYEDGKRQLVCKRNQLALIGCCVLLWAIFAIVAFTGGSAHADDPVWAEMAANREKYGEIYKD